MPSNNVPRYKMSSGYGDLVKGMMVFLSQHHRPIMDGHRMVTPKPCGLGAAYSVPEGLLIDQPYDELDED